MDIIMCSEVRKEAIKKVVQTPINKSFIPNRPIGKLVSPNKLYIFQPNPKMKREFYERFIRIE